MQAISPRIPITVMNMPPILAAMLSEVSRVPTYRARQPPAMVAVDNKMHRMELIKPYLLRDANADGSCFLDAAQSLSSSAQ